MRIVVLADVPVGLLPGLEDLPKPVGHYATWLEALIPEFEAIPGLDLHWIVMAKGVRQARTRRSLGQTLHVLPRYRKLVSMLTAYRFEIMRIRRLIRRLDPQIVHAWGSEDVYGLAGACSGCQRRVFTLQGCQAETVAIDPRPALLARLQASFEPGMIRRYPVATGESELSIRHLRRIHPGIEPHRIECGVPLPFFGAHWNPSDQPNVLFAGRVCSSKGVHDLIEAFRAPSLQGIVLNIAGQGDLVARIQAEGLPNVRILGRLSCPELIAQMEQAWCLVIPTYADTGPSVVKEARVVGLPVITTTAAGAATYISEAGCGFVIEPGNRDQLAAAMARVCASRDACLALGRNGWAGHREVFHPGNAARQFAELYRSLAGA